ncbi:MAG: ATP-binding protein [Candidatus Competibacteraceae bacterium]|jgi:anti-sigma regulatory factor (Ser/Thr protein kinase)|nr:ATP-binding protein [Candidatus Competibacteraceae bacterium]
MSKHLEIGTITALTELEQASDKIRLFCTAHNIAPERIFHLDLALDELVSNFFRHGHDPAGSDSPAISIDLLVEDDCLITAVKDNGIAFNPLEAKPPDLDLSVEDKPIGGLGLHLVSQFIDELDYQRAEGWNCLTLRQRLTAGSEK